MADRKIGAGEQPTVVYDTLPLPDPRFTGVIGATYEDSKPDIITAPSAPPDAPNVLLILLDDVGFGQAGAFGGPVNMPTLQRLAREGLTYNRFHTTAFCSTSAKPRSSSLRSSTRRTPASPWRSSKGSAFPPFAARAILPLRQSRIGEGPLTPSGCPLAEDPDRPRLAGPRLGSTATATISPHESAGGRHGRCVGRADPQRRG
jgi:Sulfatase